MKKVIVLVAFLLVVIPCQAKTITVEASKPVSVTIEADDFNDATDISTAFADITFSRGGTDHVYAVTSTKANGFLGTNVIGPGLSDEVWYGNETFRIDFNGFAKRVSIRVILAHGGSIDVYLKGYNSLGSEIAQYSEKVSDSNYRTLSIQRYCFEIAYVTVKCFGTDNFICLDHAYVEFQPVYHGSADFTKIQDAINSSNDGDVVLVLPGIYYEGINFYGLSSTVTSTDPDDVNRVNDTIIDGIGSGNAVTFESLEGNTSVLTGFTITNGDRGIYCYYSEPLISNCVVKNNGTGIYGDVSSPAIRDSVIESNSGVGISGCDGNISDCIVSNHSGSGISDCRGEIVNCKISENGGGLSGCQGEIINCLLSYNFSNGITNCNADISNCTIVGNKGHGVTGATQSLINNIIVNNCNYGVDNVGLDVLAYNNIWGNLDGSYSNVIPCPTDIHKDPRFAIDCYWDVDNNWVEGEYHLKSAAGRWTESGWVYDDVNSPCIDAGDPNDSVGSEPNPNGGRINMGAYGGTAQASKSPSGIIKPVCTKYPAMDFNKDCTVDFEDFAQFTSSWLECNLDPPEACWE